MIIVVQGCAAVDEVFLLQSPLAVHRRLERFLLLLLKLSAGHPGHLHRLTIGRRRWLLRRDWPGRDAAVVVLLLAGRCGRRVRIRRIFAAGPVVAHVRRPIAVLQLELL